MCKLMVHLHLQYASKITKQNYMKQTILVTGASSGFGLLVANELHRRGYNVIGTSRNSEKYASKLPFKMIALDLDLQILKWSVFNSSIANDKFK